MNRYPEQNTARSLAQYGRYGDDQLIHVSSAELRGIAALAPGGRLTINPVTGQHEAFSLGSFLQTAVPIAAAVVAPYAMPALAPAIAGGIGSGLATAAMTGDIERGLVSGISGAGIGAAAGAAGDAIAAGATEAVGEAITTTALEDAALQAGLGVGDVTASEAAQQALIAAQQDALTSATAGGLETGMAGQAPGSYGLAGDSMSGAFGANAASSATPAGYESLGMRGAGSPFTREGGSAFMKQAMSPTSMFPIAIGQGQLASMDQQDKWDKQAEELAGDREESLSTANDDLQRAYAAAQPGAAMGLNPYRSKMSRRTPLPGQYAGGGITSVRKFPAGGYTNTNSYSTTDYANEYNDLYSRLSGNSYDNGYDGIDPVTVQQGLRGQYHVQPAPVPPRENEDGTFTPGRQYMAGFNPEFSYFQNDPDNVVTPATTGPADWSAQYSGMPSSRVDLNATEPYFKSILPPPPEEEAPAEGLAEGGNVSLRTATGNVDVAGGGIANIGTEFSQPQPQQQQGGQPSQEDVMILAKALLEEIPQADQIVEMFVQKYGPEVFQAVRDMILKSVVPGAQTDGMVKGQGGGMDDQVRGMIGNQQPVAVSPGEYIVPADVVSGLGDGSSDSGAQELDMMLQNVRQARQGGAINQPPPINARSMMPA